MVYYPVTSSALSNAIVVQEPAEIITYQQHPTTVGFTWNPVVKELRQHIIDLERSEDGIVTQFVEFERNGTHEFERLEDAYTHEMERIRERDLADKDDVLRNSAHNRRNMRDQRSRLLQERSTVHEELLRQREVRPPAKATSTRGRASTEARRRTARFGEECTI